MGKKKIQTEEKKNCNYCSYSATWNCNYYSKPKKKKKKTKQNKTKCLTKALLLLQYLYSLNTLSA